MAQGSPAAAVTQGHRGMTHWSLSPGIPGARKRGAGAARRREQPESSYSSHARGRLSACLCGQEAGAVSI